MEHKDIYILVNLLETPVDALYASTVDAFPATTKRQFSTDTVRVVKMSYVPFVKNKLLKVSTTISSKGKNYDVAVEFSDVVFHGTPSDNTLTIKASDQKDYHFSPIKASDNDVKVRCTCLDFHWRFAMWNYNDGSLIGMKPKLYKKKTDRPPVNPKRAPGMCKHIMKAIGYIQSQGMLVD